MDLQELLIREGLVEARIVTDLAVYAEAQHRSLAEVLVEKAVIAEDALADVVARAISSVVIEVHLGALDAEAVRLIPEGMARRYLAIPIARGPGEDSLRVAFANPLDEAALDRIRSQTGYAVEALVATVSGLRQTIEREYSGRSTTQIIQGRPEMQQEDTRQIESYHGKRGSERPVRTAPMHRLESEAPIEQRHEAMLLALIEAGVLSRSDYIAALKRLRGHSEEDS